MKGHIRRRGKKSWAIVIELGRDAHGKRKQRWHSVKGTKRDAEQELHRLVHSFAQGSYVDPHKVTVGEFLDQWLAAYAKGNVSGKTFERYQQIVRNDLTPALGSILLAKLQPMQIQSYYTKALASGRKDGRGGLAPKTVIQYHRILREALQHAVKWRLLAINPCTLVEPPKVQPKEIRVLDSAEAASLLRMVQGKRLYYPILVGLSTGMRRGEVYALRWKNVDLHKGLLRVVESLEQTKSGLIFKTPKSAKGRRSIALSPVVVQELRRHKREQTTHRLALGPVYQNNDLVFPRADGTPWPPNQVSTLFKHLVRGTALEWANLHTLRHTHATDLLREGIHPKVVSEQLGHSTVALTLDVYSHVMPSMQDDAARALDATLRAAIKGGA